MKKSILFIIAVLFVFFFLSGCYLSDEDKITDTISQEVFDDKETLREIITFKESATEVKKTQVNSKIVLDTDPAKGEYFVYAIINSIDKENNIIEVKQLINEPKEKIIEPKVLLASDCQIVRVILELPGEKESFSEIGISNITLGSEIGIIFKSDNTARVVIYQEIIEND